MVRVMTVDLEDWFHSQSPSPASWVEFERRAPGAVDRLLKLFEQHSSTATFFVLGDVARAHPRLIERIAAQGHEIASHGMTHRLLYRIGPDQFRRELRVSIRLLENLTGCRIASFRAPYFSVTRDSLWALEILAEEGIEFDSSIFPVFNHRYGIHDAPRTPWRTPEGIREWPVSTLPTVLGNFPFAGGAYFRMLPWCVVKRALSRLEARDEPLVFYIHPWEIDPGQPRLASGSPFADYRHYANLDSTERKLERLLALGGFTSLAQANHAGQPVRVKVAHS